MPTLVIRPRYVERVSASERRAASVNERIVAVENTLTALPPDVAGQIKVLNEPQNSPSQWTTFIQAADVQAVERIRASITKDVVVEELIEFRKATFDLLHAGPLDLAAILRSEAVAPDYAGGDEELSVTVKGSGRKHVALAGAEVYLILMGSGGVREVMRTKTNEDGEANFKFADFYSILSVIVVPYSEFWPRLVRGGPPGRKLNVVCEPLPSNGPSGWWHKALGIRAEADHGKFGNTRIKIGVIDSGCGPHPAVDHVLRSGAFINGTYYADGGYDSGAHGTHVCGIIAGNSRKTALPFFGIAPGAEVSSVRVFPEEGSANQGDIADAIDFLVEQEVHLINMSLGADARSVILEQAIKNAFEHGVLCICAAGNDAGQVSYPAAFTDTVAVSAIGELGFVPLDSLPALPTNPALFGRSQLYAADFTNFGREVHVACPGVGIIAPVPDRGSHESPYASMSGTSMASPIACAALAILLSHDRAYIGMRRGRQRARYARNMLTTSAQTIELPREYEGSGLPILGKVT
jgi:subtilisin family serine protease